jgi:hypothetical protein
MLRGRFAEAAPQSDETRQSQFEASSVEANYLILR